MNTFQLDCEVIHNKKLADETGSNYADEIDFVCEDVTRVDTVSISKGNLVLTTELTTQISHRKGLKSWRFER